MDGSKNTRQDIVGSWLSSLFTSKLGPVTYLQHVNSWRSTAPSGLCSQGSWWK